MQPESHSVHSEIRADRQPMKYSPNPKMNSKMTNDHNPKQARVRKSNNFSIDCDDKHLRYSVGGGLVTQVVSHSGHPAPFDP